MEQTNSGISTEAEILSAAAKDPKLSDNAFKEILLRASKMDEINATEVLSHCARNSSLNKLEHLKAFLETTEHTISSSSPKLQFIYQTFLERDNLNEIDINAIAHGVVKTHQLGSSAAKTIENILSQPNLSPKTAQYINDFFVDKLDNGNFYKGKLISLMMNHPKYNSYDSTLKKHLTEQENNLIGDGKNSFNQAQKDNNAKRIKKISDRLLSQQNYNR